MTRQVVKFATLLPCMPCDLGLFTVTKGKGFSGWSDLLGWQGRWRVALWVSLPRDFFEVFLSNWEKRANGQPFGLQLIVVSKLVSHQEYCGPGMCFFLVELAGKVQYPCYSTGGVVVPICLLCLSTGWGDWSVHLEHTAMWCYSFICQITQKYISRYNTLT